MTTDPTRLLTRRARAALGGLLFSTTLTVGTMPAFGQVDSDADVVVLVDTSASMDDPGMDPERTSLLVTKLFADIVPGNLAVLRSVDLTRDRDYLPREYTGEESECADLPGVPCAMVTPVGNWNEIARRERIGALVRPPRGIDEYKETLAEHLTPQSANSQTELSLRSAQGVFESFGLEEGRPRILIWLSDGISIKDSAEASNVEATIEELGQQGVAVHSIVFARGSTDLAEKIGIPVRQVQGPADLIGTFADLFREVVEAPYRIDARVSEQPVFEVAPHVDEAWIVVYGDASLAGATVEHSGTAVAADHAAENQATAGSYRVAYLERPTAGRWSLSVEGGGPGAAYAVIQRSALAPALLEPERALAGTPTRLVVAIQAGSDGDFLEDAELLGAAELTALVGEGTEQRTVRFTDDGTGGDEVAGDGRFSATTTFPEPGTVPVRLELRIPPVVGRSSDAEVVVSGLFRYTGEPVLLDLGTLAEDDLACRPLTFEAEHRGRVPFVLRLLDDLPGGHELFLRTPGGEVRPGDDPLGLGPEMPLEICLATSPRAGSSTATGTPWLSLEVAGSDQAVPIHLAWQVDGLTWLERWWRVLLAILALLALAVLIAGYVLPHRFSGSFALSFVPEREDLDDQSPQPVRQWPGVRVGFFRDARAYLHPDFRLSGKSRGALAVLRAERRNARVLPGGGAGLYRETLDGDWESVAPAGRSARPGEIYRIGERGPFFRIGSRR